MVEALDIRTELVQNRRSLRDFSHPQAMRDWIVEEHAYQLKPEEILARIRKDFPDVAETDLPSLRTIADWRLQARREWREECHRVMAATLGKAAKRAVPDTLAFLFSALSNQHELMEEATLANDWKTRTNAAMAVGKIGNDLLNQFRGGPAEGASAVSPELIEAAAVRQLIERGVCANEAEARAHFLLLSESVGKAMPTGEGSE